MIKRDFKDQKLTRKRRIAIKKIQYLTLYTITMYFLRYLVLKFLVLTNFVQNKLKAVVIIDFKCKNLEKYIVIGQSLNIKSI